MPRTSKNPKKTSKTAGKSKSAKQQLEEKKLKHQDNQDLRNYHVKMKELENELFQAQCNYNIRESEIERQRNEDKYNHEEKLAELKLKDRKNFYDFILEEQKLYIDFIGKIIGPLQEIHQQKFKELSTIRTDTIQLLERRIKEKDEELKELNDKKIKAYEEGNYSVYSQMDFQIHKAEKVIEDQQIELKDFIDYSWNDLQHIQFQVPSPQEFLSSAPGIQGSYLPTNNKPLLESGD